MLEPKLNHNILLNDSNEPSFEPNKYKLIALYVGQKLISKNVENELPNYCSVVLCTARLYKSRCLHLS